MNNRRLKINAITSILQTATSAITLVILYRYLIDIIGVARFGVWSLVVGISSLVGAGNLGLTGSLVKYVADYDAVNDNLGMSKAIQTGVLTTAVISLIVVAAGYPLGQYYLRVTLAEDLLGQALEILPIALAAFWIMMLTNVYQSALYGRRKVAERNMVLIFEAIAHLGLCAALAHKYGLVGLAYARFLINIVSLILTIGILKRSNQLIPFLPYVWNKMIFRSMLGYSLNTQLISLLVMLCDPLTKGLLSRFGSAVDVGYYEMANKAILQIRAVIVNSFQVMVPEFARMHTQNPEKIKDFYYAGFNMVFFVSLCCYATLMAAVPLISQIWLGSLNDMFMFSLCVLSAGWFLNTIAVPAYFANQGTGYLRDNVFSHILTATINVSLGYLLGLKAGTFGIVLAWGVALGASGLYQTVMFQLGLQERRLMLVPIKSRLLYLICGLGLVSAGYLFNALRDVEYFFIADAVGGVPITGLTTGILVITTFVLVVFYPMWKSPFRKELLIRLLKK